MRKSKKINYESIVNNINLPLMVLQPKVYKDKRLVDFDIIYYNEKIVSVTELSNKSFSTLSEFSSDLNSDFNWIEFVQSHIYKDLQDFSSDEKFYRSPSQSLYKIDICHSVIDNLIVVTFINLTTETEHFQKLKLSLITDKLTGFINRTGFNDTFPAMLENAQKTGTMLALMIIDIDNLKNVNDSMGAKEGDTLIMNVANVLRQFQRGYIRVFRYGDDEFAVVLTNIASPSSVYTFSDTLYEAFQIKQIGVSAGISIYPENSSDEGEIIKFADMAVHYAKKHGKNSFEFFEPDMQRVFIQQLTLQSKLTNAILENNFKQYYQPQFDIRTGKLRGFEALIRWHDEELGDIAPSVFIPIAEETGLIIPLGRWVLNTAVLALKNWHEKYNFRGIMSVNVSPIQLKMDSFIPELEALLDLHKIDPSLLEVEITEGVMINDVNKTVDKLNRIRELGIRVSLDDFGTGYSSLSYLQMLPLNTLKIDKAFINDITAKDGIQANITSSIITMVENMGLETIAEGVEHPEQLELLNKFNCNIVQGFLRGKPMPFHLCDSYLQGDKEALLKL